MQVRKQAMMWRKKDFRLNEIYMTWKIDYLRSRQGEDVTRRQVLEASYLFSLSLCSALVGRKAQQLRLDFKNS